MDGSPAQPAHRFRLDLDGYQLLEGDCPVRLERQPMELLILLVERKGQLVTRDDIAARLWADGVFVDTDRNINSIVRKLRQALKDDPDHPEFLETVVGKGYRFVGPVLVSPKAQAGPGLQATLAQPPSTSKRQTAGRRRWQIAVSAGVVIAALAGFAIRHLRSRIEAGPAHSLAILPLENLSGDKSQDYFADGFTQELTTELAQVSELRVISHTSVQQYKNRRESVPEIAKELQVDAVIEGSVSRSGDRVRVAAQLIRAPSDHAMWANSYERDLRDVLGLQRDIAKDIAEQVKIKLVHVAPLARPVDREAHDLYLQGLYHYDLNTEQHLLEAVADFQRAIAKDPEFAASHAGLT